MGIKDEKEVILGDATKDFTFSSKKTFGSEAEAARDFPRSVDKLFDVDRWSDLPGITSRFELHDAKGNRKLTGRPQVGDHVKIILPGIPLAHWVRVINVNEGPGTAEYTTSPSTDPASEEPGIKHFFIKEASSKFRVDLMLDTIEAHELGRNEGINNKGEEAGNRKLINTMIAEGGWAGFQKLQWEKVTNYLVHNIELDGDNGITDQ